jgi:penicillin-insensitive murein DD-endopeptidase
MMLVRFTFSCLLVAGLSTQVAADSSSHLWGKVTTPAPGAPRAIGYYSTGCVQGARALPLDGPGYQVMHPSRTRHFGHPDLIDFIARLGQAVHAKGLAPLLIADLSQPRGGRARGGHASHQTGLDVDIWYWHPNPKAAHPLSSKDRERLRARSILDGKAGTIRAQWKTRVTEALRATAADPRVTRIFVHPIIKRDLCADADGERAWLGKVRPWYGHDDHFHVRLACPTDSPDCQPQEATPPGDGCGEDLDWWFDKEAQAERLKARAEYRAKVVSEPKLPPQCEALIKPVEVSAR